MPSVLHLGHIGVARYRGPCKDVGERLRAADDFDRDCVPKRIEMKRSNAVAADDISDAQWVIQVAPVCEHETNSSAVTDGSLENIVQKVGHSAFFLCF